MSFCWFFGPIFSFVWSSHVCISFVVMDTAGLTRQDLWWPPGPLPRYGYTRSTCHAATQCTPYTNTIGSTFSSILCMTTCIFRVGVLYYDEQEFGLVTHSGSPELRDRRGDACHIKSYTVHYLYTTKLSYRTFEDYTTQMAGNVDEKDHWSSDVSLCGILRG
jgi:hypothetical protein